MQAKSDRTNEGAVEGDTRLEIMQGAFRGCFGCGDENGLGLRMAFERDGETVVSRTQLGPDYAGYPAFAHGGVVATMLDEAMGWAMLHLAGRHGVTRSLNVTYRRPVPLGRELVVRARVTDLAEREAQIESTVEDSRGRMLAHGAGSWVVVRDERARQRRS